MDVKRAPVKRMRRLDDGHLSDQSIPFVWIGVQKGPPIGVIGVQQGPLISMV